MRRDEPANNFGDSNTERADIKQTLDRFEVGATEDYALIVGISEDSHNVISPSLKFTNLRHNRSEPGRFLEILRWLLWLVPQGPSKSRNILPCSNGNVWAKPQASNLQWSGAIFFCLSDPEGTLPWRCRFWSAISMDFGASSGFIFSGYASHDFHLWGSSCSVFGPQWVKSNGNGCIARKPWESFHFSSSVFGIVWVQRFFIFQWNVTAESKEHGNNEVRMKRSWDFQRFSTNSPFVFELDTCDFKKYRENTCDFNERVVCGIWAWLKGTIVAAESMSVLVTSLHNLLVNVRPFSIANLQLSLIDGDV